MVSQVSETRPGHPAMLGPSHLAGIFCPLQDNRRLSLRRLVGGFFSSRIETSPSALFTHDRMLGP